jgi:hypothetical protein
MIDSCRYQDVRIVLIALTTAWFLSFVNDLFDAMNARHKEAALFCCKDTAGKQVMEEMLEVIENLGFNGRKLWKPVQTGIRLSTSAVLQLSQEIMTAHKLQYFMTGRLSQDPVENLFSQARGQGVMHPSCTIFRQALRLVTIAQFLKVAKGAAYEDGCTYIIDYLQEIKPSLQVNEECMLPALLGAAAEFDVMIPDQGNCNDEVECLDDTEVVTVSDCQEVTVTTSYHSKTSLWVPFSAIENVHHQPSSCAISSLEGNALYDVIGWAAHKALAKEKCEICNAALTSDTVSDETLGRYTATRTRGALVHPSKDLLLVAQMAEHSFLSSVSTLRNSVNMEIFIKGQVQHVLDTCNVTFPSCHVVVRTILSKYIRLQINEHTKSLTSLGLPLKKQFGSKTACRITSIL